MKWTVSLVAMLLGCNGVIGDGSLIGTDEVEYELPPLTYNEIFRSYASERERPQLDQLVQDFSNDPTTGDVELNVEPSINVVNQCPNGDFDLLANLCKENQEAGDYESACAILSVEGDGGVLLGSVALSLADLEGGAKPLPVGTTRSLAQALRLRLPSEVAEPMMFRANMFICQDTTQDGTCGDEQINAMGALLELNEVDPDIDDLPRIVAFRPMVAYMDGTGASFKRLDLTAGDQGDSDPFALAAREMADMLDNIEPEDEEQAMTITLGMGCESEECYPPPPPARPPVRPARTNGCFVAGTRVDVGNGLTVPVEEIWSDSEVAVSDGRLLRVVRSVAGPEHEHVITIRAAHGQLLTVTQTHPVLTVDGLREARALEVGDTLMMAAGESTSVAALSEEPYHGLVFNFAMPGSTIADHLVVAEGLVVGDLTLQEELSANVR